MKKSIPGRSGLSFPTFAVKGEQMWCRLVGWVVRLWRWLRPARCYGRRKVVESEKPKRGWNHPKPPWVAKELVRLKAMDEHLTCRTAAAVFNRIHGHKGVTVQRTYVSNTLRKHLYEIMLKRREVRRRRPGAGSQLRIMGLDLTGKTDESGKLHYILGALDHGSRACLTLRALSDKTTVSLLRALLDVIERYGKPKIIRTDNERIFTSRRFRFALWLLGITHQRIDVCCPWQNGRIERFFGTLKGKLNRWSVNNIEQLDAALHLFRFWYNHIRPHQHLQERTPAEVWDGVDMRNRGKEIAWFDAWDGLLTGYYIRR